MQNISLATFALMSLGTYIILDTITTSSKRVVLKIQYLETGVKILHELTDYQRSMVIAECD